MREELELVAYLAKLFESNTAFGIALGLVAAVVIIGVLNRWFRRDRYEASRDQTAQALLDSISKRLDTVEKDRNELDKEVRRLSREVAELAGKLQSVTHENERLTQENLRLRGQVEAQSAELNRHLTTIRELQMKTSEQVRTIEDLQLKVRNLEQVNSVAQMRTRRSDDARKDGA